MKDIRKLQKLANEIRVLYVEDDSSIQNSMVMYLSKFFKTVIKANDGVEGVELYKKEKIDLVITDLSMPRMNGLDMLIEIKEIDENQAILITSAHSEAEYLFGAIKAGVDGYIIKPFDYEQLNSELFKIVNKLYKFKENEEYKQHLQEMVQRKTVEISKAMLFQSDNYEKTLNSMVEIIEERDTYTAGHSKRVAEYSKKIAQQMGFSKEDCTKIYQAGILHDIGKIATPDAVLLNPKSLDDLEYKLIQEHVTVGYNLLKNIPMFQELAEIIKSHHERYDGKGYPRAISENEIEPLSRIMMVADAFDAMTTNRIYKAKKSVTDALSELEELKLKQFHPEVVESALIALRNIEIDENISQTPKTKLEEERFAYFYRDSLGSVYNQNYLDLILIKNNLGKEYKNMELFSLKNFSQYNRKYSWNDGDILLNSFATCLNDFSDDFSVFRIFGDDFVILSKKAIDLEKLKPLLDDIVKGSGVFYKTKSIDLTETKIMYSSDIEHL